MVAHHVVITGGPGAGKTTLGRMLATTLPAVLLSKDQLKEAFYEAMPVETSEDSLRLSRAVMRVLHGVASSSGAGCVMEANWNEAIDVPLLKRLDLPLVQLVCVAPPDVARRRVLARIDSGERHPVHRDVMDAEVRGSMLAAAGRSGAALDLGCPVLVVDTGREVDADEIAGWVRGHDPT